MLFQQIFRKQNFLSKEAIVAIQEAIALAEKNTSGEIRVFIEKKCPPLHPLERAKKLFEKHQMFATRHRNGILIYLAYDSKKVAIYGDEGIHQKVGQGYWEQTIRSLLDNLSQNEAEKGLRNIIHEIGSKLKDFFPYDAKNDTNELSNDILFHS